MSTGSIFHDVVISDPGAAKRFIEALEAAEQAASLPRHPAFEEKKNIEKQKRMPKLDFSGMRRVDDF